MKTFYTYLLISVICLTGYWVKGQYTTPEVIAASGDFFSLPNVSLSWTSGEVITETFTGSNTILTQGFQQVFRTPVISGQLTYRNTANTPVSNAIIYLNNLSGIAADSTVTLSNGSYRFYNTPPGTYVFGLKVATPWGGVNATDALQVLKHFVHIITLTNYNFMAGNVDGSVNINSIDALMIAKRFASLISAFVIKDWLYMPDTATLGASPVIRDIITICAGDANGSYIPPTKSSKNIDMVTVGEIRGQLNNDIIVPITAAEKISLGAVSLVLDLEDTSVHITNVEMPSNTGTLVFNVVDRQLRISWYSAKPLVVEKDAPVFMLTMTSDQVSKELQSGILFRIADESEIANPDGIRYPEVTWNIPAVCFGNQFENQLFTGIIPNPFSTNTRFVFSLPEDGMVSFTVYNTLGNAVLLVPVTPYSKGLNLYTFDGSNMRQGIYMVRFDINVAGRTQSETRRMVITR